MSDNEKLREMRQCILQAFASILVDAPVDEGTDFFAEGGTSLDAMRIIMEIQSFTGQDLTFEDLVERPTPNALAAYVYSLAEAADASPT